MTSEQHTPEDLYSELVEALLDGTQITQDVPIDQPRNRFGATALKTGGKIFALLFNGRLVLKLPRQRVDAMIDSGEGIRFDPGHGRRLKEWVTVGVSSAEDWLALAEEARAYVESLKK